MLRVWCRGVIFLDVVRRPETHLRREVPGCAQRREGPDETAGPVPMSVSAMSGLRPSRQTPVQGIYGPEPGAEERADTRRTGIEGSLPVNPLCCLN